MSCLTKMLGIGKSEKARFEVRVTGDDDQVFVTEMSMSALKNRFETTCWCLLSTKCNMPRARTLNALTLR
jgi:hypothetical protein